MDDCDTSQVVEVPECTIAAAVFSERAKVTSICWSPDSSMVAATSDDGYVKLLKLEQGVLDCIHTHGAHKEHGKDVSK